MNWVINIAIYVAIVEIVLIIFIIIATYTIMLLLYLKNRKKQKLTICVTNFLATLVSSNQPIDESSIPQVCRRLDIIVPVLDRFSKLITDDQWKEQRYNIIRKILLPQAREASKSNNWEMRFFAAICFSFIHEAEDEKLIVDLIKDNHPLISLNALNAAISYGSEEAIDIIISKMSEESWLTRSLYLQLFEDTPLATRDFINSKLMTTDDPSIKATCYAILLKYPPQEITWDINKDMNSTNMHLSLSAVRYFAYLEGKAAIPILTKLLKHEDWQARAVALSILSNLNATEIREEIRACLQDPNEWVRLYAAETLNWLETSKNRIVRERDIAQEKNIFNIAMQVLDTY